MVSQEVTAGTRKYEAVRRFVQFMTGEHAQTLWLEKLQKLPSNARVAAGPLVQKDPLLAGAVAQLRNGIGRPAALQLRCFWDAVYGSQQAVLDGKLAVEAAPGKMQEYANRCLKETGLAGPMPAKQ
jgi:maltose-binding protein MalE